MPVGSKLSSRIIDEKDRKILMVLQKDGRVQLKEISKKVGLSIDSVHKRIKEMKKKEVFYTGIFVNPRKIGFHFVVDVKIRLKNISAEGKQKFIKFLENHKRCTTILSIMGDYDLTCVFIAKDSNEFDDISSVIRQKFRDAIDEWKSILVLKTYKIEEYDLT